jgi:glycosyltransferase involved in cell wall biosynthesis
VTAVAVVVPDAIDDPARASGGNAYDRRLCDGLAALGWSVRERHVADAWPCPGAAARAGLARVLDGLPDGALVLVDGLLASPAPAVLAPHASRLRLVVLLHLPLGDERERAALGAAAAVVTTSAWARRQVLARHRLPPGRVHVAEPAVDPAALAPGSDAGGELLCVAPVARHKGHDLLLDALVASADLAWRCACVGSLERDARFAGRLRRRAEAAGLAARVRFEGPRTGEELARAYASADLLVLPSRGETYGMVVTEALARGVPVVAADVGGVPEALGRAADGSRPGVLVPAGDAAALATAIRAWLTDAALRTRLRRAARERRASLAGWAATSARVAAVLAGAAR